MNEIQIGWIDYSSEHREKVMAVLDALREPGAVDELGIGRIRDGFADKLFPGTSTIQTRAKYFLIVPYLLMELEKENYKSSDEFLNKLGEEEIALIEPLKQEGSDGVIGNRAGTKLKRKPSSIYWNGLRTFDIFRHDSLSLNNYAKMIYKNKQFKEALANAGNEEMDDKKASDHSLVTTYWKCLLPHKDWKKDISLLLKYEEAKFLHNQIITAPQSKDSLLAYLLQIDYSKWGHIEEFEDLSSVIPNDGILRATFDQAKQFSKFLEGAHIRYNLIASYEKNETAVRKWEKWKDSCFVVDHLPSFPFKRILDELHIRDSRLRQFLSKWKEAVISKDENKMDELIIKREIELKSPNRAKLHNSKMYYYKENDWIGNDKLNYRFPNAKIIMEDIIAGLG